MPGSLISKCVCDVVIASGSGHLPIICSLKSLSKEKSGSRERMKIRQLKSENLRRFQEAISCMSWDEVLEEKEDVSVAFDKFLNMLLPGYDSCYRIEIVKKRKKEPGKAWINAAVIENTKNKKQSLPFLSGI